MDGTFNTNMRDLVLLAGGPGGVGLEKDQPVMQILLAAFVIADAEDVDGAGVLRRLALMHMRAS